MDKVRPYIAYALAISWNIEFYELDKQKLQGSIDQANALAVDVLLDRKYQITERAKDYLGAVYTQGQPSEVRGRLRLVESNFENFIIDVRIWCVESLADVYEMIKHQQRAMKNVLDQNDLIARSQQLERGSQARTDIMEVVMDSRIDMTHFISKIFPIIDKLMGNVDSLEEKMDSGILRVIQDARVKTQEEIQKSKDQDKKHSMASNKVLKNIKKTTKWLEDNERKINDVQNAINNNAMELDRNLDKKREKQLQYQEALKQINKAKDQLQNRRHQSFNNFQHAQKQFARHLQQMQKKHKCKFNFKKQFMGNVKGCEMSATQSHSSSTSHCARFLWWCVARYSRSTSSYSRQTWTDQTCYKKALAEQEQQLALHMEGERADCRHAQQQFQKEVEAYNIKMQERVELYDSDLKLIDEYQKEENKKKEDQRVFRNEAMANIQKLKQELLDRRSLLLISQHNHVKAQAIGRVFKADLEDKMEEFSSMTGTLRLTKMSLREVEIALNRVNQNLKSFKVALKIFETKLKASVDRMQTIKREMDKCDMSNPTQKCRQLENLILAERSLSSIQDETLAAAMGGIVLGRMYNSLYGFLTNLKEYPVGLYNQDLTVDQNIKNFKTFVSRMNEQEDFIGQSNSRLANIGDQIDNINAMRASKGLGQLKTDNDVKKMIQLN